MLADLSENATRRSRPNNGGAERDRTDDLLHAMQALSQLSYSPTKIGWAFIPEILKITILRFGEGAEFFAFAFGGFATF
jgi:hypothetical protein